MQTPTQPALSLRRRCRAFFALILLVIVGGGWVMRLRNVRPSLDSIGSALKANQLDLAYEQTTEFVRQNPDDLRGRMLQAEVAEQRGDFSTAAQAYQIVLEAGPFSAALHHRFARALLQSANFERAEYEYRSILKQNPGDEKAQTEIQWMLFHQQRERELEAFLEECLSLDPDPRLLYHLLVSTQKPPNPLESFPVLQKIDAAMPGQLSIQLGLARCAWRSGNIALARTLFEDVLQKRGMDPELGFVLAEFELEQSNFAAAEEALRTLKSTVSTDAEKDDRWWWLHAQLAQHRRDFGEALTAVNQASRLRPREMRYLHLQATLLRILGRPQEASVLQAEVEARRIADRELYDIVNHSDLNDLTAETVSRIARNCRILKKIQQAELWEKLRPIEER